MVWKRQTPDNFWSRVDKSGDCWIWTGAKNRRGYGVTSVDHRQVRAHRLAWEYTHGSIPGRQYVCHTCDNPPCCNPAHLFLGTHEDNMRDRSMKKRVPTGERGGLAKLTWEQVRQIRRIHSEPHRPKITETAARFNVSPGAIAHVLKGLTWKEPA